MTLVRPSVLPDELGDGFKGRLMRLNGITREKIANQLLLEWAEPPRASLQDTPTVDLLAKAAGMEAIPFVRAHTMVPLRRSVVSVRFDRPHGHADSGLLVRQMAMRLCRPAVYFCEDCVREDFGFHGWVYWKREHQLPGLYWCPKHGSPLRFTNEPNALLKSPSDFLSSSQRVEKSLAMSGRRNDAIARFIAIESELLNHDAPIDAGVASRKVRRLASKTGLYVGVAAVPRGQLLSDMMGDTFGGDWLSAVIPGFKAKVPGHYCLPIDKAVWGERRSLHCSVYIAAFAALFDEADSALAVLLSSAEETKELKSSDDDLRQVYAQWWGASDLNAQKSASIEQAPIAPPGDLLPLISDISCPERRQALKQFVLEGKSLGVACEGNGQLQSAVEALLRMTAARFLGELEVQGPLGAHVLRGSGSAVGVASKPRRTSGNVRRERRSQAAGS